MSRRSSRRLRERIIFGLASCFQRLGVAWAFACLAALTATAFSGMAEIDQSSLPPSDHCVILVSLDGFAHFYVDDPLTHMPALRRMIREGAVAERGMECSFPTVTWPNHT